MMQQIKTVKKHIDEIRPYWNNPRKNDAAVEAVAASIREYGYVTPIVIDTNNVIISGHTRYRALIQLNVQEVECIVSDMPENKARGFRIIDNKTSELAQWDSLKLVAEIRAAELKAFEEYFPEIKLDIPEVAASVPAFASVTPEQIAQSAKSLEHKYDNIVSNRAKNIKEIACPHCGAVFETN